MIDELEKIKLELCREANGIVFDRHFKAVHIPTIDRLFKLGGKYKIKDCNCYYCNLGKNQNGLD